MYVLKNRGREKGVFLRFPDNVMSEPMLSQSKLYEKVPQILERGGLVQIRTAGGQCATGFALACLKSFLNSAPGPPPLSLWISDEGLPYAPLVSQQGQIPLSRFLYVKVPSANEAWKVGIEATQTSLFAWIFLRPTKGCPVPLLRKLQLCSERTQTRLLLLMKEALPHWPLKFSTELTNDKEAHSFFGQFPVSEDTERSLLLPDTQSVSPTG